MEATVADTLAVAAAGCVPSGAGRTQASDAAYAAIIVFAEAPGSVKVTVALLLLPSTIVAAV
jgi:hypothetical protein